MNNITLLFFGALVEVTQCSRLDVVLEVKTVHEVEEHIICLFPALKAHKYSLALNETITEKSAPVSASCRIAFLPPFAGG